MFIVLLRFAENRAEAGRFMDGHKAWIGRGFADGVFLMAGTLQPGLGGAILAHAETPAALRARVDADPFVAEGVVTAEVLEIDPARTDDRLAFLLAPPAA